MKKKNSGKDCKICGKIIVGGSYKFKAHLYLHNAVLPRFKCIYCGKEFFRNDVYAKHMNRHTGAGIKKTFICDHCDRGFAVKRNLVLHLRIHDDNGYTQYKCIACGTSYCEERLLKYHIRKTHFNLHKAKNVQLPRKTNETWVEQLNESNVYVEITKVKNSVLSIKKFGTVKDELNRKSELKTDKTLFKEYMTSVFAHKDKSHYSKAVCDYCNKEMLKKSLISHIRERHLKLRRFKCDDCSNTFKRHYQLVDHVCGKFKQRKRK